MTTITQLREIIDTVHNLSNKKDKLNYLNQQSRDVLNFLSGNIKKDGIAKAIASEIIGTKYSVSTMEDVITTFESASNESSRTEKITYMRTLWLSKNDREFILTTFYGSLKLGLKIPVPEPKFGDTIKPQLCGTGIEFDPKNYIIEEKFDGIRCIATKRNGKITLQSRNGKVLNVPCIKHSLIHAMPNDTTVDGEIVATDGQFESLNRKSNNLIYMIFDIIFINIEEHFIKSEKINEPLYIRRITLKNIINETAHIKISPILSFNTMNEINEWVDKTGAEGIIAKNPNGLYQYGDRKEWIKVKPFLDCTCNVIDYTEGTGKRKGIMGAINVIPEGSSKVTKVGSGFTDDQLIKMKQLIDDDKEIKVDVKYQNLTNDGALRFPIFLRIRTINGDEI